VSRGGHGTAAADADRGPDAGSADAAGLRLRRISHVDKGSLGVGGAYGGGGVRAGPAINYSALRQGTVRGCGRGAERPGRQACRDAGLAPCHRGRAQTRGLGQQPGRSQRTRDGPGGIQARWTGQQRCLSGSTKLSCSSWLTTGGQVPQVLLHVEPGAAHGARRSAGTAELLFVRGNVT
jgi:hypothetical protein